MVWTKFQQFVEDKNAFVHHLFGENDVIAETDVATVKAYLTNTTPNAATHAVKADLAEIALAGGYLGPKVLQTSGVRSGATFTLRARGAIIAQQTGPSDIGPFRYLVLYNDTPTSPMDPLIAYTDFGSPQTLTGGSGDTVDLRPNNAAIGVLGILLTEV